MPLIPASSHSPVVYATKTLTAAQIAALGDDHITIVPAITGRKIVPLSGAFDFTAGTVPFALSPNINIVADETTICLGSADDLPLDALDDFTAILSQRAAFTVAGDDVEVYATENPGDVGPISASTINNAGSLWAPTDTATVNDGTGGLVTVSTVGNSFAINQVNQGGKTFRVTGDASAFAGTDTLTVYRSTGNDDDYTIVSAVFSSPNTTITVVEAIPSAVADGRAGDATAGDVGSIATYALTNAGTGYTVASHDLTAVAPSVGTAASITVSAVTSQSDGTARVTVYYAIV